MNLIAGFVEIAETAGRRPAIIEGGGAAIGFAELAARSARLAAGWRAAGIGPGDRVLIAMPVGIDLYAAIAGLWRIGATIVFPEPALGLAGLRHAVEIAGPDAVLATGFYRLLQVISPAIRRIPRHLSLEEATDKDGVADVDADHPALISFTSGSTGAPKGIVRSHGFLAAQNAAVLDLIRPTRDDETDLVAFPVFVIANLGQGVTSVLPNWKLSRPERARAEAIAAHCRRHGVTRLLIPPAICETVVDAVGLALDAIFTGGGPVFPDLLKRLLTAFPETHIVAVYGSTEAEPVAHLNARDITADQWRQMSDGSGLLAGRPVPQIALRLMDDEIFVTGDHVNQGYLDGRGDAETKVRQDGHIWHRTGDAGRLDDDGNLWLRGRRSAVAGGLYPFEVEPAARQWPGVRQAALVPGSDPPLLAVEGQEPEPGAWQKAAAAIPGLRTVNVARIPLDRRHRSKVDYGRLGETVAGVSIDEN